jgi:hypothetical protein
MGSCPACGHLPVGPERYTAWLLSSNHLEEDELAAAAARIVAGEPLRPTPDQLARARAALNPLPQERIDLPRPEQGLSPRAKALFLSVNLLFTPLFGLAAWWSWRNRRPHMARDALRLTVPVALAFGAAWLLMMWAQATGRI